MARSVSLKELDDWLNKPEIKRLTWFLGDGGPWGGDGSPAVKYFDFCLDTRTYDVWSITARSFIPDTTVRDDNEKDDKTILDLMEDIIKKHVEEQ